MEGWIRLHRSMMENPLWDDKPFSKGQAWIDLLLLANHKNKDVLLGNSIVNIQRGSFITSELKLIERWGWSKTKVRAFLKMLEDAQMIIKISDRKKTTITIEKYKEFQDSQTIKEPQKDHKKTVKEPLIIHNQEGKNERIINTSKEVYEESNSNSAIPYHMIQEYYNSVCRSYPRLVKMSEKRKKAIKARMNTGYTIDDFRALFDKAEASNFLKGKNERNWSADFDWLVCDGNMAKTLEGKYDNREVKPSPGPSYRGGEMEGLKEFMQDE